MFQKLTDATYPQFSTTTALPLSLFPFSLFPLFSLLLQYCYHLPPPPPPPPTGGCASVYTTVSSSLLSPPPPSVLSNFRHLRRQPPKIKERLKQQVCRYRYGFWRCPRSRLSILGSSFLIWAPNLRTIRAGSGAGSSGWRRGWWCSTAELRRL